VLKQVFFPGYGGRYTAVNKNYGYFLNRAINPEYAPISFSVATQLLMNSCVKIDLLTGIAYLLHIASKLDPNYNT